MNYFDYQAKRAGIPANTAPKTEKREPRREFDANRALALPRR